MRWSAITTHEHYSLDETLKFVSVNWQRGELDFNVVHKDKSTIEVMLRMKFKDGSIYLGSFKAIGIARGIFTDSMVPLEYKIPKYTYIMDVPVEMRGFRSMDDKKWDDMIATLSRQDQISWEKFKATIGTKCKIFDKIPDEELMKKIIPNYERRKPELDKGAELTLEEKSSWGNYVAEEYAKCLANSGISKDGQKKIVDLLKQMFISDVR